MDKLTTKLKQKWNRSPIIGALVTLVSGQVLGQTLALLSTPIVSRLYDTTAYGQYAIITSTATIVCSLSHLGLSSAMMMPSEDEEAKRVFSVGFWVQFTIITFVVFAAAILMPFFQLLDIGIPYLVALMLLYVHMLLTNLTNLLRIYMNRKKLYRVLFWNSLIAALSTFCITIPLGILGAGFIGFMSATLISTIICSIQMLSKANPFIRINLRNFLDIIKKYKEFVLYQFPANMITTFSQQFPNQMLGRGFGSATLGSYAMSYKVFNLPSNLIASPINTVYFKTAVDYHRDGKDLAGFTFSLVSKLMLLAFIPLVSLISFGDTIFAFILGEQWKEAGLIAAILGIPYILIFCENCTTYCRVSVGRQIVNLVMSILQLIVIIASLVIGIYVYHEFIPTVVCFAVGDTVYQIINMAVNFYCLKKHVLKYLAFVSVYCLLAGGLGIALRLVFN